MTAVAEAAGLVTPTGVLVTGAAPETPEWFAARRGGITGTDLPKILGLSKYGNALSVWLDKRGEAPEDRVGEAAEWGHLLEDIVAREWARRHGAMVERIGVLAHGEHPHHRASLDREVTPGTCPDGDGDCALEVKTKSQFLAGRFREDVPDDVLAQVAWGLHVSGFHHMHVAVLIGGQELRSFRVDRDVALEVLLVEEADRVWQAVEDGIPPQAEPDAEGVLLDLLNRLHTERAGDRELDPAEVTRHLDDYAQGAALAKEGEALKTRAKTALVQLLGDGEIGVVGGEPIFTYKRPAPAEQFKADDIKRLAKERPALYRALKTRGFITPKSDGPRFNVVATKKEA